MEKRYIYIMLTNTGTLFSRTVGIYTRAPYNHTSLGFDQELLELYSFGRKRPRNPLIAGFVRESIGKGVYQIFRNTRCCIYRLEVEDNQYERLRRIIEEFKANTDEYGYNLLGLFGVMLNRPIKRKRHYFCSEFVATVLLQSRICHFGKHVSLVTPNDFCKLKQAVLIYEGKITEYNPSPLMDGLLYT